MNVMHESTKRKRELYSAGAVRLNLLHCGSLLRTVVTYCTVVDLRVILFGLTWLEFQTAQQIRGKTN